MITGTPLKKSCPLTIGNLRLYFRQTMKALKTTNLSEVKDRAIDYDVVAIDEGQFYNDIV